MSVTEDKERLNDCLQALKITEHPWDVARCQFAGTVVEQPELAQRIAAFAPTHGWGCFIDRVLYLENGLWHSRGSRGKGAETPDWSRLLEGELVSADGLSSLRLLRGEGCFWQVFSAHEASGEAPEMLIRDERFYGDEIDALDGGESLLLHYRVYWRLETGVDTASCYQPYAARFLRLSRTEKNPEERR